MASHYFTLDGTPVNDLIAKYYVDAVHPYRTLEEAIERRIRPTSVILDIGCGRNAPMLRKLTDRVAAGYGIDPVAQPKETRPGVLRGAAEAIPLPNASVDVAYSRSVLEHLENPLKALREIRRVLRPSGSFVALTPNLWDYGTVAARIVPNRYHPAIVKRIEGRTEEDTFPAFYRANSAGSLRMLAAQSHLRVESIEYLNQYPTYLRFSRLAFLAGVAYERVTSHFDRLRGLRGWILVVLVAD
jgi:SAM-dependent methyltransferase